MTDSSAPASTPLLSITIAAYREAENLAALLPAIQAAAAALTPALLAPLSVFAVFVAAGAARDASS